MASYSVKKITKIKDSTGSVSKTTGALLVDGGIGSSENIILGGYLGITGTSNIVSIKVQAATTAFNFNLPTTAGSSGNILTSAGGGSSAMTWKTTTGSGDIVLASGPTFGIGGLTSTLGTTTLGATTIGAITGTSANFSGLTASSAVATDASKNLVSVTNTGTGNNVLATSPTLVTPVLGAATGTSLSVSGQLTSTVSTGTAPIVVSSTTNIPNLNASSLNGATFASPGAIGGTTPANGTFTNLNSTSGLGVIGLATFTNGISSTVGPNTLSASTIGAITGTSATFTGNISINTTTSNAPLQFSNSITSRKIVLYETANNDHQYDGFGINNSILRYQIGSTASNHVFYAGTGTSTSNELFRVLGDGTIAANYSTTGISSAFLYSAMTGGNNIGIWLGKNTSTRNAARFVYTHVSDGSTSNAFSLDFNGASNSFVVTGNGASGFGQSSPLARLHIKQIATDGDGGNHSDYNQCSIVMESSSTSDKWGIAVNHGPDLVFSYNLTQRGYMLNNVNMDQIDFTGQHRSMSDIPLVNTKIGYIVSSTGVYANLQENNISINEAIPIVELSTVVQDKKVFGVISDIEDIGSKRTYTQGAFVSVMEKDSDERRLIINSLGEGGIWVCDANGNIENGDYITSSSVPGIGMKQTGGGLMNYTVAKATCSVDFLTTQYETRYFNQFGDVITQIEYETNGGFIGKFIGCTYHCG
jgi:hypothetical protein